ncbi:MAG TPA: diguanylate cyclase, partial [Catenuloplanes sp.]
MPEQVTLGVLAPFTGGWYFGGLLDGIARSAAAADATVIAIQTLDAGTNEVEVSQPVDPACRIAWDHVSGFIVVVNAVSADYLTAIEAAGKPVVVVSHEFAELACPVVQPDNGTGIRAAVDHLVGHGHRRIAFVGCLGTADVRERHAAYRGALLAHGLEADATLCFTAPDNQATGGELAARTMLAAGLPSTAVVAGTDANAIGVMRTLLATGHRLPRDQAVIGFDDGPAAAFTAPALSSVKQPVQHIARTAVGVLLGRLAGDTAGFVRHLVPTELVVRESCGCPGQRSRADPPPHGAPSTTRDGRAGPVPVTGPPDGAGRPAAARTRRRAVTDTDHSAAPLEGPLGAAPLLREVRRVAAVLDGGPAFDTRVTDSMRSMLLALGPTPEQAQFQDSTHLQTALSTQYEVSMDLLRGHEEDPRQLGWLRRTSAHAGCLGLWAHDRSPPGEDSALHVAGAFAVAGPPAGQPVPAMPVAAFPPAELLAACRDQPGRVLFVVPVKVDASDWGLLAIVDDVETKVATGREPISQWTALLAVALDHQAVLHALRDRESRLRTAALYDHLTGLPNRAMFLDRLGQALGEAVRSPQRQFGVLFLDLDEFKVINDCLGHSVGDWLLVEVAERIKAGLRGCDTAARFGGDEFLILVDGVADVPAAEAVAQRLHAALARPFQVAAQQVVLTASIGIALSGARRYEHAEDLLRDADLAMYCAKSQDKGSHAVFDVAMHAKAVSRLQTETELRQALEQDEFEVHYQPINQLSTSRTYGFEALVRWRHPVRGLVA